MKVHDTFGYINDLIRINIPNIFSDKASLISTSKKIFQLPQSSKHTISTNPIILYKSKITLKFHLARLLIWEHMSIKKKLTEKLGSSVYTGTKDTPYENADASLINDLITG